MKDIVNQYVTWLLLALVVIIFFQTCGTKSRIGYVEDQLKQDTERLERKIDSTSSLIIKEDEMIDAIQRVPAWETLRLEEISDKEKISINALRAKKNNNE